MRKDTIFSRGRHRIGTCLFHRRSRIVAVWLGAALLSDAAAAQTGASASPGRTIRAAAISFVPVKFDLQGNADRLERAFRAAHEGGAKIAVAPEGVLEGYVVNEIIAGKAKPEAMKDVAVTMGDPVIRRFEKLAAELKMCLVFGFAERIRDEVFNCAVFIDDTGRVCGRHHKMLFAEGSHPDWWFNRLGAHTRAFDTPYGRCGIVICNERWNPHIARILALDGARFLVIPSFGSKSKSQDDAVLRLGRENGVPVVEANVGVTLLVSDGRITTVDRNEDGITFGDIMIPAAIAANPDERDRVEREFLAWRGPEMKARHARTVELSKATLAAAGRPGAAAKSRPARPNILFIIADDQSPLDLKAYNPASKLRTPNIDRLAAGGMTFTGAYHMGAFVSGVCLPSRYMIKTGRTLWHLPVAPEAGKRCPPDIVQNTIAAVFNRGGYDTMRVGKRGNSYEAAKKLFTVNIEPEGRSGLEPGGTAWHGRQVLDHLDQRAAAQDRDPFLIYFGFSHPHDPRNGTDELLAKYGAINHTDPDSPPPASPKQPPLPVNYLPAHPFPTTLLPDQRDETQVSGVWRNRDERTIRNEIGRYFACSESIDIQIGRVLQKLEAMGELENTWIFYTSDHGIAIGRHGLQGKQNLYQHTWRVPFIAKGPGIKPGSRVEGNIYLLDVLATLCDIAGIPAPDSNEGISFKPVLEGRQQAVREVLYGVHCGGTKPGMRCVKKGDWKLMKYDGNDGAVHETQLFNLAENPDELLREHQDPAVIALTGVTPVKHQVNLAGDPRHAGKLAEMEALLLSEMRRLHDPWRLWNQPDDGLTPPPETVPRR